MATGNLALLNGFPTSSIDATDRGFQFGDGIFTTLRVSDGIPLFANEHLQRLVRDAAILKLPVPDVDLLRQEMAALVQGCRSGILKIQWTRGLGGRGYLPSADPSATRFLILRPVEPWIDKVPDALTIRLATLRLGINPALAGAKHMNRLEQILARMEWTDSNVDESLLLDSEGFVVEGTATNVFIWKDDMLVTPLIDRAGVRGVMRDILIEMAKKHEMPVREARVRLEDLSEAKALLLTNSLRGICPVSWFEGQHYDSVAICQKIQPWYLEAIQVTRSDWM